MLKAATYIPKLTKTTEKKLTALIHSYQDRLVPKGNVAELIITTKRIYMFPATLSNPVPDTPAVWLDTAVFEVATSDFICLTGKTSNLLRILESGLSDLSNMVTKEGYSSKAIKLHPDLSQFNRVLTRPHYDLEEGMFTHAKIVA